MLTHALFYLASVSPTEPIVESGGLLPVFSGLNPHH